MSQDKFRVAAAVDIGSNSVDMKIAQYSQGKIQILEDLKLPLDIGQESFGNRRISFSTMQEISDILLKYNHHIREYDIDPEYVRVVATTALRQAENRQYILDRLQIQTGRSIEVLEDGQEKAFIFREMLRRKKDLSDRCLLCYIGTGSLGIALFENGAISCTQNILLGSRIIREKIGELAEDNDYVFLTMDEYVKTVTDHIENFFGDQPIEGFVVNGSDVNTISVMCGAETILSQEQLGELYQRLCHIDILHQRYPMEKARMYDLIATMTIWRHVMSLTSADTAQIPDVTLNDCVLYELLNDKQAKAERRELQLKSVESSAHRVAHRYGCDMDHVVRVEGYAQQIFRALQKIHGFSRKEWLYLQTAVLLHDIGRFVDYKNYADNTAHIVEDTTIIDMTQREMSIIANIARYHGGEIPSSTHVGHQRLSQEDRLTASKLAAIAKIADALDYSRCGKIAQLTIRLEDSTMVMVAQSAYDLSLEKLDLGEKTDFFQEVFGLQCLLKRAGNL